MPTPVLISHDIVTPQTLAIIEAAPLPGLRGEPNSSQTREAIEATLQNDRSIATAPRSPQAEALALAGMWLLAGELDRSHELSQSIETTTGAYWHGIMHRREGDFGNSKYWFRRVGGHPVLEELARQIASDRRRLESAGIECRELCSGNSVAEALVDLCEAAGAGKPELTLDLELICWWEWQLLFRYSLAIPPHGLS